MQQMMSRGGDCVQVPSFQKSPVRSRAALTVRPSPVLPLSARLYQATLPLALCSTATNHNPWPTHQPNHTDQWSMSHCPDPSEALATKGSHLKTITPLPFACNVRSHRTNYYRQG